MLGVLWDVGRPLTAARVREELGSDLAYSTVRTVLVRLADKGEIESADGRRGTWRPSGDAAAQAAGLMTQVLKRGPDRAAVLARFVSTLGPSDEATLRALLAGDQQ